ncbi:MFS transporter [Embleya scabrispora]|uniref:MFS transporter n=1 Tax=Embleya scabrispora TaxID=159449 RepID=UPI00099E75B9|nr:MFS transporter [Embleya scabrispora]
MRTTSMPTRPVPALRIPGPAGTPSRPLAGHPAARPERRVPALALALLAAPLAISANSPVLILPDIAADLGVSSATGSWLVSVFGWAVAIGTPLAAALIRRRGARSTLTLSAAMAALGTVAVALSPWLPLLLAGRAAQAFGGAGLTAVALNLAGSVRRMGVITALFGMCGAVGPTAGVVLGDVLSWRVPLIASAVGLLAVPFVARRAPARPAAADADRFDPVGALLTTVLVSALVLVPQYPLPALFGALIAVAALALRLRVAPNGFVPVAILRSPTFGLAAGVTLALSTSYFTLLFAVPRLLARDTAWSTGRIGLAQLVALLVGSAATWGFAAVSGRLGRRTVPALLITLGVLAPLAALVGVWAPLLLVVTALSVFAATSGQATLAVLAAGSVAPEQRPTAIGLFNLCYLLGGAFGPAIAALLAVH